MQRSTARAGAPKYHLLLINGHYLRDFLRTELSHNHPDPKSDGSLSICNLNLFQFLSVLILTPPRFSNSVSKAIHSERWQLQGIIYEEKRPLIPSSHSHHIVSARLHKATIFRSQSRRLKILIEFVSSDTRANQQSRYIYKLG